MSFDWETNFLEKVHKLNVGRGFQLQDGVVRNACFIHVKHEDIDKYVRDYMMKSLFQKAKHITKNQTHYVFELRNFAPNHGNAKDLFVNVTGTGDGLRAEPFEELTSTEDTPMPTTTWEEDLVALITNMAQGNVTFDAIGSDTSTTTVTVRLGDMSKYVKQCMTKSEHMKLREIIRYEHALTFIFNLRTENSDYFYNRQENDDRWQTTPNHWGELVLSSTSTQPEETTMARTFYKKETNHYINGRNVDDMDENELYTAIAAQEDEMNKLGSLAKVPPVIKKRITVMQSELDALLAHLENEDKEMDESTDRAE